MIFVYKPLNADARTLEILKNVIVPTTLLNFWFAKNYKILS